MTAPETTLYNLVGWMLTYGLHSSVCFGLAWVCVILLRLNRPRARLAVWRTALLGPVLSATLHTTGLVGPVFDGLTIAAPARTFPTTVASAIVSPLPASPSRTEPSGFAGPADLPGSATPRPPIWIVALIGVWTVGAGTGLLRWFVGRRRLLSLISDRRPIRCGELLHRLAARMNVRQRVRVSMCDQAPVPFAFGIRSPEICLPAPLTGELTCRASQALLAHELAHVAGRDPAWQLVYWLVESTLFFQPLNRIMRRQLEHEAELLADERAASCTGRSIDLARCLVTVAERLAAAEGPQPMPAALGRATGLEERVQRLLSNPAGDRQLSRSAVALALGTVAVVIFLTPNISFIWAASARPDLPQMTRPPQPIYPGEGAIAVPTEPEPPIPPDAAPASRPAPTLAPSPPQPPSAPTAPAEPAPAAEAAATAKAHEILKSLRTCEEELRRIADDLGPEADAELARIRDELARLHIETVRVRRSSRTVAVERDAAREERQRTMRARAEERARMREAEVRELAERAREAARERSEQTRTERLELEERARELAAQARELKLREAELARQLEAQLEKPQSEEPPDPPSDR